MTSAENNTSSSEDMPSTPPPPMDDGVIMDHPPKSWMDDHAPKWMDDQHHHGHPLVLWNVPSEMHYEPTEAPATIPPPPPPPRKVPYGHYALAKKLWYVNIFYGLWFIFYCIWLMCKSVGRHMVRFSRKWKILNHAPFSV